MKLVSFSVSNYRSIIKAYKLFLGDYTVLVGPNNEGKSNILNALALSLGVLTRERIRRTRRAMRFYRESNRTQYDWVRDFPLSLQSKRPDGRSFFTLEFDLFDEDRELFREQVGVNLTTTLKIKLGFGREDVTLEILMKGPGKQRLNKKKEQISAFLRSHIAVEYVSAVRTSERALAIINDIVENELGLLEANEDYIKLVKELQNLQRPILDSIAAKIKATISDFVPAVKDIRLTNERMIRAFRTSFDIMIDDGANTNLDLKGDGIISLTTMALIKHASEERLGNKLLVLAIEEPESHLHPAAIHGLRKVLKTISEKQQVVISTHSPILVEREKVSQNILVQNGRAQKAKRIDDIRTALGIQMADNLVGAYVVLLVEGKEDRDLLEKYLKLLSPRLKSAMEKRVLVIDHLAGATNLKYNVGLYKQNVCNVHAFLDNDDAGRRSVEAALEAKVLDEADYNLATCEGMKDSELEDLLSLDTYENAIQTEFGVQLNNRQFKNSKAKWSVRVKKTFQSQGKLWNDSVQMKVKKAVINVCIAAGINALDPRGRGSIDSLVTALEKKIERMGT